MGKRFLISLVVLIAFLFSFMPLRAARADSVTTIVVTNLNDSGPGSLREAVILQRG